MASIGTHSGAFQADEALGVYMLRLLPQYQQAALMRSRDPEVLKPLTIVIDVAGTYDHAQLRYDHHQRGFFETFDGENQTNKDGGRPDVTGPETATGAFKTKLSASGLVYKHYGRDIICALHPSLRGSPDALEWVYVKLYKEFMEAIDGNDNGIEIAEAVNYKDGTSLPMRVHRLNRPWNGKEGGPSETEQFDKASALCGAEFSEMLAFLVEVQLPAREVVEAALLARTSVHPSGEVLCFSNGGCPWKTHLCALQPPTASGGPCSRTRSASTNLTLIPTLALTLSLAPSRYELERNLALPAPVKFVLYEDSAQMWRVQAVTVEGNAAGSLNVAPALGDDSARTPSAMTWFAEGPGRRLPRGRLPAKRGASHLTRAAAGAVQQAPCPTVSEPPQSVDTHTHIHTHVHKHIHKHAHHTHTHTHTQTRAPRMLHHLGTDFANRLSLPEPWRGLREEALCGAAAIAGKHVGKRRLGGAAACWRRAALGLSSPTHSRAVPQLLLPPSGSTWCRG